MHQNIAVILHQFNYSTKSFKVMIPDDKISFNLQTFTTMKICSTGSFIVLTKVCVSIIVTRLGNLLDFGLTFQSLLQHLVCLNLPHSYAIFVKVSKYFILLVKSFLGNFYRHLATFYWSHWLVSTDLGQKHQK